MAKSGGLGHAGTLGTWIFEGTHKGRCAYKCRSHGNMAEKKLGGKRKRSGDDGIE